MSKNGAEGPSKKQKVVEAKKSAKGAYFAVAAAVIAIVVAVVYPWGGKGFKAVSAEAGVVSIPVGEAGDGKAHFYEYKGVNFFLLRSSDGVIRAAFDACDVCYAERKGYRQEGDAMVCNNCGQVFPSVKINEVSGGCNPAPIGRQSDGKSIYLKASDIEQGRVYF